MALKFGLYMQNIENEIGKKAYIFNLYVVYSAAVIIEARLWNPPYESKLRLKNNRYEIWFPSRQ